MIYYYHLCAMFKNNVFDGLLTRTTPILTYADYMEVKIEVSKQMNLHGKEDHKRVVIQNLSLLHKESL